jgi:hypothetical protein
VKNRIMTPKACLQPKENRLAWLSVYEKVVKELLRGKYFVGLVSKKT